MPFRFALAAALSLCLATPALAQTDWSRAKPVQVTLSNYAFTPSTLTLKNGQAYRISFVNSVAKGHDFSAPELFASGAIAPDDKSRVEDGKVEADPGQTVTIGFMPMRAGTYKTECTHFMHAMLGMTGHVVVN